jgi:hypothetical protein
MSLFSDDGQTTVQNQLPTETKTIYIDDVIMTGSAFGVTEEGEQVFVNQRIVSIMNVQPGESYRAFVLPNYEDKRDQIQWRAIRLRPLSSEETPLRKTLTVTPPTTEKAAPPPAQEPTDLSVRVIKLLREDNGYMTAAEIADQLDASYTEVEAILKNFDFIVSVPSYFIP